MRKIENFVKHTFKDVPKEEKVELIESVTQSLIEKVEDLMENGMTEQKAIDKTVLEFGTAEDFFNTSKKSSKKDKRKKTLAHYKNDLLFSVIGSIIIIAILVYTNLYFLENTIWFVIPSIGILWWPLTILYNLLNKKESRKEDDNE